MVVVVNPKKKHNVLLKRLFVTKPNALGGFSKEDLEGIVRCVRVSNLIKRSRTNDKEPWNPRFIWQVTAFPEQYAGWTGDEGGPDAPTVDGPRDPTVLAIAKDSEFCAVITIDNDLSHIWYRMYKNDANVAGIFGSLMYAYTQGESEMNCYYNIFISFMEHYGIMASTYHARVEERPKRVSPKDAIKIYGEAYGYSKIYMEQQHYDPAFCIQTYNVEVVHNDTPDDPDEISFEDEFSEDCFFEAWDDIRYPELLEFREGSSPGWNLGTYRFIRDCMRHPTVVGPLVVGTGVLAAEIARSVMLHVLRE
ncbi:hypothetical protein T484DRAFT_1758271 [Baffinella frigidus]|nr:hypothetical protein T484DRAFT_1758271 [Cryptophyta sp. CCMP2293]